MSKYANQLELENEVGPTVRPLQGLLPNKHGSSWTMHFGDQVHTLVDVRSETNDAEMLTVSVGVVPTEHPDDFLFGGGGSDLVGRITWGIGGANFEAIIDLQNGLTFSVPANYLKVDISYNGVLPLLPFLPTVYQVSAGVGYGTFVSNSSSTRRTVDVGSIPAFGGAFVRIPAFAVSFTVFKSNSPPTPVPLNITVAGVNFQVYSYADPSNSSNQNEIVYPIRNGSNALSIVNPNGVAVKTGVIFNLSF